MSGLTTSSTDDDVTTNGLHVHGQGNALRVETHTPHLISLGTGRLSTGVTLHPIKQGRVTIGSDSSSDIHVKGTGVCVVHCRIENSHGIVTLYPVEGVTLVDGVAVQGATRLSQGSMLTIGRSNYLRFNHPEEAKLIKSVLPNTHLSMAPMQFGTDVECDSAYEMSSSMTNEVPSEALSSQNHDYSIPYREVPKRKPPVAPKKPPRHLYEDTSEQISDSSSDHEMARGNAPKNSNIMTKVSKFEYYAKSQKKNVGRSQFYGSSDVEYSPKVFNSETLTVNAPAIDVLGKNYPTKPTRNSEENQKMIIIDQRSSEIRNHHSSATSYANVFVKNQPSKIDDIVRNFNEKSCANFKVNEVCQRGVKRCQKPSPSFDRNPQYSFSSVSESSSIEISEIRREEVHKDKVKDEQKKEAEKERLEEILNICAEYEKQISNAGPLTPTERKSHNKIITNGSLPRSLGLNNPNFVQTSDGFFRFEVSSQNRSQSKSPPQRVLSNYENVDNQNAEITNQNPENSTPIHDKDSPPKTFPITELSSPILIRKIARNAQNHTSDYDKVTPVTSPYESMLYGNRVLSPKSPGTQSPRTKIKTTFNNKTPQYFIFPNDNAFEFQSNDNVNDKGIEKRLSINEELPMIDDTSNDFETRKSDDNVQNELVNDENNVEATNHMDLDKENEMSPELEGDNKTLHTSENEVKTNGATAENDTSKTVLVETKEVAKAEITELKEFEQDCKSMDQSEFSEDFDRIRSDFESLKDERRKLLTEINEIKRKMTQIRTQEDDILRELEMEKALIKGEYDSEIAILNLEQERRTRLVERVRSFERGMKETKDKQDFKQREMRDRLEIATLKVERIEHDLRRNLSSDEELQNARDILENERKLFEDLEFQHLEEETDLLAQREDLQNELSALTNKIEEQKKRILTLKSEASHNLNSALNDTRLLQADYVKLLNQVEELTSKVQKIEKNLKELSEKLSSERANSPESEISIAKFDYSPQTSECDDLSNYEAYKKVINDKLISVDQMSQSMTVDIDRRDLSDLIDHVTLNDSPKKEKKGFWERNFDSLSRKKKNKNKGDIMSQSLNENMFYNNENIESDFGKFEKSNSFRSKIPTFAALGKIIKKESFSKKNKDDLNKSRYVKNNKATSLESNKYLNKAKNQTGEKIAEEKTIDSLKVSIDVNKNRKSCGDEPNSNSLNNILSDSGKVPSQDDIDRISKVTLDAPIFESESDMNSLDRKTLDSLKEIERNRIALLEEQGCQVMESEREKILELKKRVHAETKKNWENKKNCARIESEATPNDASLSSNDTSHYDSLTCQSDSLSCQDDSMTYDVPRKDVVCVVANTEVANPNNGHYDNVLLRKRRTSTKEREERLSTGSRGKECDTSMSLNESSGIASSIEELQPRNSTADSLNSSNLLEDERQKGRPLSDSSDISNDQILSQMNASVLRRNRAQNRNDLQRPLTRYLPTDRDDFDLKQHIESAGHQVVLCPHVIINSTSCRGYLHKLGAKFHTWSKRWFVFDRDTKTFIYYSDKTEKKPRGGAYFQVIEEVYMDHGNVSKSPNPQMTFVVKTRQRKYYLMSPSSEAVRIWIDVIFSGAQGYMGYYD